MGGIAAALGIDVEDLNFSTLAFFQIGEMSVEMEFDGGFLALSSIASESGLNAVLWHVNL